MDAPATGRDIIAEILRNMREGMEPLRYTTLAPGIFRVYLHPDDFERLRAVAPRIAGEARRALDDEMAALNRSSLVRKLARRGDPPVIMPEGGWQIELLENTDDDARPGDIVIHSELALPSRPEYGSGSMTKRIRTGRVAGQEAPPSQTVEERQEPSEEAHALFEYEDRAGRKSYRMTKNQIVIGRGGRDYWTDLKLETLPDVSREHARVRRDPDTGGFYIKDMSSLGTTVNGAPIPSSVEMVDGEKRDLNVEVGLPLRARIGLAGVVFLEFSAADRK